MMIPVPDQLKNARGNRSCTFFALRLMKHCSIHFRDKGIWGITLLLVSVLGFFQAEAQTGQATRIWALTTGGSWATASNWSPSGVPQAGDNVVINGITGTASIKDIPTITLTNLTLLGNCTLDAATKGNTITVNGTMTVASGITVLADKFELGFNIAAAGVANIDGTLNMTLNGQGGIFTCNGRANMGANGFIGGTGSFVLSNNATLAIASTAGIMATGTTGNIRTTTRTFNANANYIYNGTAAQNTGDALPATFSGSLTIDNPTTVTLAAARTISSGNLNLLNGQFIAGSLLTLGNSTTASNVTINRRGGSLSGTPQSSNWYNIVYNGVSKITGPEVTGSGMRSVTINLDAANDLTLDANRTIPGTLTLTNGHLITGSFALTLTNTTGTAISGGSASSYINGTLVRNIATGSGSYFYPVGTSSAYAPVTMNMGNVTAAGTLTAFTSNGDAANISSSDINTFRTVNRSWNFAKSGALAVSSFGAKFEWFGDQDANFDFNNAIVGRYNGTAWAYPSVGTKTESSIQIVNESSFGTYQIGKQCQYTAISSQPSSVAICEGNTTDFQVSASGDGTLEYTWSRNDQPLVGETLNTINTGEPGNYKVLVSGECRTATSDVAVLSWKAPTVISADPVGGGKCAGDEISVTASGEGTVTYQWFLDGNEISNANTDKLSVNQAGDYSVKVNAVCGELTSEAAIVTMNTPTSILSHPQDVEITYGEDADFGVNAEGTGQLTYRWQVYSGANWNNLTDADYYANSTGATLNVNDPVVGLDGFQYKCFVSGLCGTVESEVASIKVNKAILTVTPVDTNVIYGDAIPVFRAVISGFQLGQNLSNSGVSGIPELMTVAEQGSSTGNYDINADLGTLAAANYDFNYERGNLSIRPATLQVQIDSLEKIYGDANPTLTYSISGYKNGEDLSTSGVEGDLQLTVPASETTGIGNYPVTVSDNTLTALNYEFNIINGNLKIGKATLEITADDKSRLYGDANPSFTFSVSGFKNDEELSDSVMRGQPAYATVANPLSNVGPYDIVPSLGGLLSDNYTFTFKNGSLDVQKAPLTITAVDKTRKYGETNPSFEITYNGFKNEQTRATSDLQGAVALSTTADTLSPVGDYTITTGEGDITSNNYQITRVDGILTVEKSTITVTIENKTRKYGEDNPEPTYAFSGFKNSEVKETSGITGELGLNIEQVNTTGIGTYLIKITSNTLDAGNYDFLIVDGNLEIEKAVLAVKADDKTRIYGEPNPEFTITINGYKNGEDATGASLTGAPDFSTEAKDTTSVGTYSIQPSIGDLSAPNYSFTFAEGTITIEKASLTVTAVNKERKYGEINPVFEASYIGFKNNEDFEKSDLTGQPSLTTTADTLTPIGTYTITATEGDLASRNYTMTYVDGDLKIDPAQIAITIANKTKTYGDANPALTYTLNGFENGEDETSSGMTGAFEISVNADETTGVGEYPIEVQANTLAASNYAFNVVPGALTIEKATLDVTAEDNTRIYGDPEPNFSATITGFRNTDDLNSGAISGAPAFTTNAEITSGVGDYDILPQEGTLLSSNYAFNFIKGKLSITPASLTVTALDTSREYGESNPTFAASYTGFKNGEDFDLSDLTGSPGLTTIADPLADVGTYTITAANGDLFTKNYSLSFVDGTLTVNKATITVRAVDTSRVYGGANPVFSATYNGFKNSQILGTSDITGSPLLSTTAITNSDVGQYPINTAIGDLTSTNYKFSFENGVLNITKATLTVSADNKAKAYGSANPALTVTYTGLITGQTLAQSDVTGTPILQTSAEDTSGVGTYPIIFESQNLASGNYSIVYTNGQLTINKAAITVQVENKTREYGDANPVFTYTLNGYVLGQDLTTSGVTGIPTLTTTAVATSSPGTFAITAASGSLAAVNYSFVMANGTLTITKAVLTVKADDKSKAYGSANPTFTAIYIGFKLGQDLATSNITGRPNYSTTATTASAVGTYPITITSGNLNSQNYSFSMVNGVLTVNKATVIITANNQSRVYGNNNPALTVTYTGFVNGQNLASSGITGSPSVTTDADSSSNVGTYVISPAEGTLRASNYDFTYALGTLTITKAPLTVTADTKIKLYGDANPLFTASYTGFKLGQDITTSGITGAPALTSTATLSSNVGTYPITAAVGTLVSSNYSFTYTNGSLIIGKATLTVTADDKSKTFGAANPTLTITYSGFKLGQVLGTSGITGTPSISTTATASSGVGTYPITVIQGTMASTNYSFTFANGTLTVNKAVLTVTADNKTKAYGAANPTFTATFTGFVNGQNLATSGVSGSAAMTTTADATSPVGTYPISIAEGTLAAANYSFTYANGTLTVGKATITITAANQAKVYGEPIPAMSYTINGFVNGEDLLSSDIKGGPNVTTAATQTSPAGIYPITVSIGSLTSSNYTFAFVNANLVVSKATIIVKANDASRVYGAANPTFTSSYNGFVNGETFANSGISGTPSYTTTANAASSVGTYPITPATGTLSSANYAFSFENGTLTVTKATLTVSADNKSRAYGSVNPALTYTVTGFVNGQNLASSGVTGAADLATTADASSPVGTYPINIQEGTLAAANYSFTYANGNLTITKAVITVSANNATRTYGAPNPTFTATYNGFVNGEDIASSGVTGLPGITTTASTASAVGTYPITPASGTLAASNYSFNFVNGTLTITKATLIVKADDKSKLFGSANPAFTASYNGFVNGETLANSGVSGSPALTTTALTNSVAGKYPINIAQGTLASTNYTFSYSPGTLSVNMGVTFTKQDPICLDGSDGSVTIAVQGANGSALTYSFDNGTTYQSGATINGLGVGTYKLKVRDADGNESVVADAILNIEIARWIGSTNGNQTNRTDWANPVNWSNNKVPTAITHVIIPAGFTVNINGNASVASVQVAAGSTVNVANGIRLTVAGKCGVLPN